MMAGPFDEVVNAEDRCHQTGYEAGIEHGRLEGRVDGFATGQAKGMEMGDEIGYYFGFAEGMLEVNLEGKDKLKRQLMILLEDVKSFRCLAFNSPTYQEYLWRIRGKFRQVSSMLKFKMPIELEQTKQSF